MTKNKTTLMRVYRDDLDSIRLRFPNVKMADFFHISVKSNPFLQAEAILRMKKKK